MAPAQMRDASPHPVDLAGALTIDTAEDIHRRLTEGLARAEQEGRAVHLDCSRAEGADITILQLLLAAARDAAASGIRIKIDTGAGAVAEVAAAAGLADHPIFRK